MTKENKVRYACIIVCNRETALGIPLSQRYFTKINEVNMKHFNFSTKIHTPNYMMEKTQVEHLNTSQTDQIYVVLHVIIKHRKFVHLIV